MTIHPLAAPLSVAARPELTGGRRVGVLLSHGFTGSPASMKPWGEFLAEQGYAVEVPRLPGHGTTWQDMNKTAWSDWYGEAARVFEKLQRRERRRRRRPASRWAVRWCCGSPPTTPTGSPAWCVVNPAFAIEATRRRAAAGAQARGALLPGDRQRHQEAGGRGARLHQDPAARPPTRCSGRGRCWSPTCPGSPRRCSTSAPPSTTSSTSSSQPLITSRVSSREITERRLEESFHVATLDNDAPQIFEESADFVARVTSRS